MINLYSRLWCLNTISYWIGPSRNSEDRYAEMMMKNHEMIKSNKMAFQVVSGPEILEYVTGPRISNKQCGHTWCRICVFPTSYFLF